MTSYVARRRRPYDHARARYRPCAEAAPARLPYSTPRVEVTTFAELLEILGPAQANYGGAGLFF